MKRLVLAFLIGFILVGCAGRGNYEKDFYQSMQEAKGVSTIEDMIKIFGLPDSKLELDEGIAYSWKQVSFRNIQAVNLWTGQPLPFSRTVEDGREMIMIFDKETKTLKDAKYREW